MIICAFIVSIQYIICDKKIINKRNVKCTFFSYKNVTQSVRLSVYKNATESALFFVYKNVMQSELFFVYRNAPPPFANFKNSMKNCVTQSVRPFTYKERNANCFLFC